DYCMTSKKSLLDVEKVHAAPFALGAARRLSEQLGHRDFWVHATRKRVAMISIGRDHIIIFTQDADRAYGHGFLATVKVAEAANLAVLKKHRRPFLKPPDQEHLTQPNKCLVAAHNWLGLDRNGRHRDKLLWEHMRCLLIDSEKRGE